MKVSKILFSTALVLFGIFAPVASQDHPDIEDFNIGPGADQIQARLSNLLTTWRIPNATIAVAQGERLVYAGPIHPDSPSLPTDPVRANVRGRIASLSKSITAAAILKLVDDDANLTLEDSAFQILSGSEPPWDGDIDPRYSQITVRHLLQHRAGWGDGGFLQGREVFFEPEVVDGDATPETIIQWIREHQELTYEPGESYYYSNIGYSILGRIIERKSGQLYGEYVQENVLTPAGINNMELGSSLRRNDDEFIYRDEGRLKVQLYDAAGGWIASAPGLLRFLIDIQYGNLSELYEDQEVCANSNEDSPCYRAGWWVDDNGMRSHAGKLPGTVSYMEWQPDGMSWAFIANFKPDLVDQFLAELKNVINTEIRVDDFSAGVAEINLFDCDPRIGQPVIGDGDPNVPCWE